MARSGFIFETGRRLITGSPVYYLWMILLTVLAAIGIASYIKQLEVGLIATGMQNYVSWGLYIGNFTFLVGVAAAAVLLIIPAYLYDFGPIKEVVVVAEVLAVCALLMCLMFVTADLGRPDRFWHLIPGPGILSLPRSLLAWDIVVLNGYLFLNLVIPGYLLWNAYHDRPVNMRFILPFILLSIPWAVSIHTVTAFIYNGLAARPFWNASILAPRFLASAFCSGPALVILLYQLVRKYSKFHVKDEALFKIAEMIAIAMAINLFLLGAEFFKEIYSDTHHLTPLQYLYQGLHGKGMLVPWIRTALAFNVIAFVIFLIPATRKNFATLNLGCALIIVGIWIEKGMGLIIPGFIPAPLGEVWEYAPTTIEILVSIGIWSIGLLLLTAILKIVLPIETGEFKKTGLDGVPIPRWGWAMTIVSKFSTALTMAILGMGLLTLALPVVLSAAEPSSTAPDLNSLLEAVKSPDPAVAVKAAQEFKKKDFPMKAIVPALAAAIKHPNEVVRLTAIEALSDRGPEAAPTVPALGEALKDKDPLIREAAALALCSIGKPAVAVIPDLLVLLGDYQKRVRDIAAPALAGMGKDAVPGLVKALESKDPTVRAAASEALGTMRETAVPELMALLSKGTPDAVRAASRALINIGPPAVGPLIALLRSPDAKTADMAAAILEKMGASAVPGLVKALRQKP